MNEPITAPEMLRRHIDGLGIQQQEAAARWGVSKAALSLWLRGMSTPDGSSALLLQSATGIPFVAWFDPATAGRQPRPPPKSKRAPSKGRAARPRTRRVA